MIDAGYLGHSRISLSPRQFSSMQCHSLMYGRKRIIENKKKQKTLSLYWNFYKWTQIFLTVNSSVKIINWQKGNGQRIKSGKYIWGGGREKQYEKRKLLNNTPFLRTSCEHVMDQWYNADVITLHVWQSFEKFKVLQWTEKRNGYKEIIQNISGDRSNCHSVISKRGTSVREIIINTNGLKIIKEVFHRTDIACHTCVTSIGKKTSIEKLWRRRIFTYNYVFIKSQLFQYFL